MMKTKRKDYEKPAMQVVELRQQGYLLQNSGDYNPYGSPIPSEWE